MCVCICVYMCVACCGVIWCVLCILSINHLVLGFDLAGRDSLTTHLLVFSLYLLIL